MSARQGQAGMPVPRVADFSQAAWAAHERRGGGPLLIEGALRDVPALERWSPEYLAARAGHNDVLVEYSVRGIYRPDPCVNAGHYLRERASFAEALQRVVRRDGGLHRYLSTVDLRERLPELLADAPVPPWAVGRPLRGIYLFAGGAGTGSHLHYDITDNLMAVLRGHKRVLLFAPGRFETFAPLSSLYSPCNFSAVNPGMRGVGAWAQARGLRFHGCDVRAGQTLLIPLHYWHFVVNETASVGMTYSFDVSRRRKLAWRHLRVLLRARVEGFLQRRPELYGSIADRLAQRERRARRAGACDA